MNSRRYFIGRLVTLPLVALPLAALSLSATGMFSNPRFARAASGVAGSGAVITLPPPNKEGGLPLMQALNKRKSSRSFSAQPISEQTLSDLLWATWGVSRADGRRTAPTARNEQQVAVFAAMQTGVWRYEGKKHELVQVLEDDTRADFGGAPLTLVYAAEDGPYGAMHLGSLYQNAGLYCASAGLANVVKATGVEVLQGRLPLPKGYRILIVQSIGIPKS